jgi:hypothetical protein
MRGPLLRVFFLISLQASNLALGHEVHADSHGAGPALRTYTEEPISHRLGTKIKGKVLVGEDLILQVTLSSENGTIHSCQWTSPDGTLYHVDKENPEGNHNSRFIQTFRPQILQAQV